MMEYLEVAAICNSYLQQLFATQLKVIAAMDLSSAQALLLVCKSNAVQQVMLTGYKEEAKAFAHNSRRFSRDIPEPPVPPANRCRMRRGGGRCRGAASEVSIAQMWFGQCRCAVSELSITQMCAYHQARHVGDLNVDGARRLSVQNSRLFQWDFQ